MLPRVALALSFALIALPAALVALPATLVALPAAAMDDTATVGDITVAKAWTRQAPPGAKVGGGYLTVTNAGDEADRLTGARADHAPRVEIHEMSVTDGVMRMVPLRDGLVIAPGETIELKPGGYHIMFMNVTASPAAGDTVPVTLVFERAGEVRVDMPVAPVGAPSPHGGAPSPHGGAGHSGHGANG